MTGPGDFQTIEPIILRWAGANVCGHSSSAGNSRPAQATLPFHKMNLRYEESVMVSSGGSLLSAAERLPMGRDRRSRLSPHSSGRRRSLQDVDSGTWWRGRRNWEGPVAKDMRELQARDSDGVRQAAGTSGLAQAEVLRLPEAVLTGDSDASAAVAIEFPSAAPVAVSRPRPRQFTSVSSEQPCA